MRGRNSPSNGRLLERLGMLSTLPPDVGNLDAIAMAALFTDNVKSDDKRTVCPVFACIVVFVAFSLLE